MREGLFLPFGDRRLLLMALRMESITLKVSMAGHPQERIGAYELRAPRLPDLCSPAATPASQQFIHLKEPLQRFYSANGPAGLPIGSMRALLLTRGSE
jgi:hypothetical protein